MQVVRNVVIPSAMTWIIASLHVAFGFAVIGAIVGEVLGAQHGLGVLITDSQNNFNADGIFAGYHHRPIALSPMLISLLERRLLACAALLPRPPRLSVARPLLLTPSFPSSQHQE